jgi:hypothetical protein
VVASAVTDGYAVVVPVHDNAATLAELRARLEQAFAGTGLEHQVVFVDDASSDGSWALICELAASDDRVLGVRLAANVRQSRAISAGCDAATLEWIVVMDADLEDAPEALPQLLAAHRAGHDLVVARRRHRRQTLGRRTATALLNASMRAGGLRVADLGSSYLVTGHHIARALADELRRSGSQLVLPRLVATARSPRFVEVDAGGGIEAASGYSPATLLAIATQAVGVWVAPIVERTGRRALPIAAVVALAPGPAPRARRAGALVVALVTGLAGLARRASLRPLTSLYEVAEVVGPVRGAVPAHPRARWHPGEPMAGSEAIGDERPVG